MSWQKISRRKKKVNLSKFNLPSVEQTLPEKKLECLFFIPLSLLITSLLTDDGTEDHFLRREKCLECLKANLAMTMTISFVRIVLLR